MGSSPVFLVPSSNSFHKPPKSQPARSTRPISRPPPTQGATTSTTTTLPTVKPRRNPPPKQPRLKPRIRTEDDLAAIWSTGPCDLPSSQNGFLKRLLLCEKVLGDKHIDKHPQPLQPPPTPTPLKPLILLERYGLSATPTPTSTSTSSRSQLSGQPDLMMVSKMAGSKIRRPGSIVNKRASRVSSGPEKPTTHISTSSAPPADVRKRVIEREANLSSRVPLRQPTAQTHKKSVSLGQNPNPVRRSARAPTRKVGIESVKSSRVSRSASRRTVSQSNASTTSVLEERSNQAREDRMKINDIVSSDNEVSEELAVPPGDVAKLETVGSPNEPMGCEEEAPSLGCDDQRKSSGNKENEDENKSHNIPTQKPIISPSPSLPTSISARISLLAQFSQPTSVSHNHPLIGSVHLRKPHLPELPDGSRASRNERTQREIDALRTMKRVEMGGVALIKGRVLGGNSASKINVLNSTE